MYGTRSLIEVFIMCRYSSMISPWCSFSFDIRMMFFFFFQAEDGIRDVVVTGVQTCALPIFARAEGGLRGGSSWAPAVLGPAARFRASGDHRRIAAPPGPGARHSAAPRGGRARRPLI